MYTEAFQEMEGVLAPQVQPGVQHAWHLYILLVEPEKLTIDRSRFIEELKQRNIGTSVHFIPLHLHPYYQKTFGYRPGDFPNAEWVYQRCISLPIYPGMTDGDTADVIEAVEDIVQKYRR
jgi:dTDP-4-amino-4,6-dideoxygalactose transaminase